MKKQNGFVSNVLEDGSLQISLTDNSFIMATVDKLHGKVPSLEEVKKLSGKNIDYIVTRSIARHTVLIEI
ncbi:MAG: hypothetical protein IM600_07650 [Bacteroidetes bacterium]|nr:hypothetical protein [Bacteroidota bacterium]MCA6443284.1 hypothetical protein [Bacteroidota bacterium]